MSNSKLTGYPSIDKPWLKYYKNNNAFNDALNSPKDISIWQFVEDKLKEDMEIPAIEYFGKSVSRQQFIDNVFEWVKIVLKLGIAPDDIVAVYGPFFPDICYLTCALNYIGATPYFLKLSITKEALEEETKECKFAIVYDGMWDNVKAVFENKRFEKILFVSATDSMPILKKMIIKLLSHENIGKIIKSDSRYITVKQAKSLTDNTDTVNTKRILVV